MKVGILTYHHTTNYGATLQTYALWKTLKEQNHEVEVIDYRPSKAAYFYLKEIFLLKTRKKRVYIDFQAFAKTTKAWKMRKFLFSRIQISKEKSYVSTNLNKLFRDYDAVVCGSDQIWCIDSPIRGFDPSYFLDFLEEDTRRISYAASVGATKTLGKNKTEICNLLSKFHAIAVRDSHSLKLIAEECQVQPTKVLDPTFLASYDNILLPPKLSEKYLLVYYQFQMKPEEENLIKSLAQAKNLKIISVGHHHKVADSSVVDASPEEWLGYFSHASHIITNTFHGSIFSMLFRKNFNVFIQPDRASKILDLLQQFNLLDRIVSFQENCDLREQVKDINYDPVEKILEEKREASRAYLLHSLSDQ